MVSQIKTVQTSVSKMMIVIAVAVILTGGIFVSNVFGAGGGGDPCADGIPDARFNLAPGTKAVGSLEVSLDAQYSVACASPIAEYSWDFGDGVLAQGMNASHEYGIGTFRPALTITDEAGLTNTYTYYTDVIVKADNQAPVLSSAIGTAIQGQDTQFSLATNASDPDGDSLSQGYFLPGATSQNSTVITDNGTISLDRNGRVYFHAYADASGQETVAIGVRDGFGGEATSTLLITIDPRLTAVDDAVQTYKNTAVTVDVKANDFSYQDAPFNVTWREWSNSGLVQLNPDGTITFTPNGGFTGTASFDYYINSNVSGSYYASYGTVNVEVVLPPNYAPVAANDTLVIDEDATGSLNVLTNDRDQDGDSFTTSLISGAQHGTASLTPSGALNYTPKAHYNGDDSVVYEVTDVKGAKSTATVNISVRSVNDIPTVGNDNAQVAEDGSVNVAVLANDSDVENGSNLVVQIVTTPANGTASVNADKTVTYRPSSNYNGADSFVYRAVDADGASRQATVSLTISSVNDAPVAVFSAKTSPGNHLQLDATSSSDVDGNITSYQWNFGNGQTVTTSTPTTSYKYKARGTYQVSVIVTDNQGLTSTLAKTITL